jgi:glyoxylase-like metal-dependent hydrolase (beta-lactamase superfamily II)
MDSVNLQESVEISDGVHWVGTGSKTFLSRNSYLRVFSGGGKNLNLLIDPGPPVDLDVISHKVTSVIGSINRLHMMFINHQDPDVVGNVAVLSRLNPQAYLLATEDTWRLVSLFGLKPEIFRAVERFNKNRVSFPTGHRLQFVPTPFCHFRGACMLYDLESRILFSGDFFGGIASMGLFATENNWPGIKAFHQLYMPSNDALKLAVSRIRALDPAPLVIAPQHGGIIQGPLMEDFMARMEALPVGLDIISTIKDKLPILLEAVNEILNASRQLLGDEQVKKVTQAFHADGSYPSFFALSNEGRVLEIKGEPMETMEALVKILFRGLDTRQKSILTTKTFRILMERGLPPFDSLISQEVGVDVEFINDVA